MNRCIICDIWSVFLELDFSLPSTCASLLPSSPLPLLLLQFLSPSLPSPFPLLPSILPFLPLRCLNINSLLQVECISKVSHAERVPVWSDCSMFTHWKTEKQHWTVEWCLCCGQYMNPFYIPMYMYITCSATRISFSVCIVMTWMYMYIYMCMYMHACLSAASFRWC